MVGRDSIWIIGSSLIVNAAEHVEKRPTGTNLGFDKWRMRILWAGISGMDWFNMVSLVHAMFNAYGIPRALVMHVGGNDIGAWSTKELLYRMKICIVCYKKHVTRLHTDISEHITSLVMALFLKRGCNGKESKSC